MSLFPRLLITRPAAVPAGAPATPTLAAEPVKAASLVLGSRFPKIPRPTATNTPGGVVAPAAAAPFEPAAKPAADASQPRQTGGFGRVTASVPAARPKAPEKRQYREYFDRHGRPSIHPDDIPF